MNQSNQRKADNNFFPAPHALFDDEQLRKLLTHTERDFLIVLCHLDNRYADKDGWFWHTDCSFQTQEGKMKGFTSYGFGTSSCKRIRKKLIKLGFIEIKENPYRRGRTGGTMYRINKSTLQMVKDHHGPKNRPP